MASDTAPAAVPGPNTPPPSTAPTHPATSGTQQPTDGLAGLLAPVQPTRTAFSLDPDPTTAGVQGEQNVTDAHSAGFTAENPAANNPENTRKNSTGRQERSVIRAWMLAGAERWRKGADARNKRLDIKKAQAQARQVKETVTVNRSEKTGGGPSNSSSGNNSGAGKSLTSKSNKGSSGAGPKNSPSKGSTGGSGSSGGSGGGGSRTPASSGTDRGTKNGSGSGSAGRTDKTAHPKHSNDAKLTKDSNGKTPTNGSGSPGKGGSGGTSHRKPSADKAKGSDTAGGVKPGKDQQRHNGAGGKTGGQGPAGKPGKDAPHSKSSETKPAKVDLDKKAPKPKRDRVQQDTPAGDTTKKTPGPDRETTATAKDPKGQDPKHGKDTAKDTAKDRETTKDGNADKDGKTTSAQAPVPRPRVDTRTSREAGYRDGTRVGKVVAHTQAYRHGYRDGRTDTAQAAAADKTRLDQAHTARKEARTQPEDKPVTQPASSTDYQPTIPPKPDHKPGPQPVPVTSIDATHVHLGDTAARPSISRGEVRTLRRFQQRLADKNDRMTQIAEATRTLEHHAQEQTKQITTLLEQARGVKGGEKLVASLTKLADAAEVQATKAAEIHKRAVRSQEACKTLTANTETRYGGIYKAVVDSPETSPAEMNYYREMAHA